MWEIFGQMAQNLLLASWVALRDFLQISWELTNYGIIVDEVNLLLDLCLEIVYQPCNAFFDADSILLF